MSENSLTKATQSQKLMVFVLSMSLYGLATMFSELIPSFYIGIFEISVEYFFFIPLSLAMLFDPMSVALGAALGEVIFSEIMLGQFGGIGEIEKFITVTIGIYIAGRLVKDPSDTKQVGIAAFVGTFIQLLMGTLVDIGKVQFAIEDFEAVEGLPQTIWATEGWAFLNDMLFSGILFAIIPTVILVPKLYRKIEPLLGMEPRTPKSWVEPINLKVVIGSLIAFAVAIIAEFAAESGVLEWEWEAEWAESSTAVLIGIIVAAALTLLILFIMRNSAKAKEKKV